MVYRTNNFEFIGDIMNGIKDILQIMKYDSKNLQEMLALKQCNDTLTCTTEEIRLSRSVLHYVQAINQRLENAYATGENK